VFHARYRSGFRELILDDTQGRNRTLRAIRNIIERDLGSALSADAACALAGVLGVAGPAEQGARAFSTRDVTVLLADLRGYTAFSERCPAHVVLQVLNDFLVRMTEVVTANGGRIEKFMGDSVMAVFGLPEARPDDALRAVVCGLQMQAALEELNARWATLPAPPIYMGIGLSSGAAMTGMLGSAAYCEHAVIGDEVNLAARIEAVSLRGQVLLSDSTYERCASTVQAAEPISIYVKGRTRPVRIREALAVPERGLVARRHDLRASPRVETRLPFTYHVVHEKVVASASLSGMVMDLSYHGAALRLPHDHPPRTELKLAVGIPFIGTELRDIYARIIRTSPCDGEFVCGVEFTDISEEAAAQIHRFVDYLLQSDPALKKP